MANLLSTHLAAAGASLDSASADLSNHVLTDAEVSQLNTMLKALERMRAYDICNSHETGKALAQKWGITAARVSQIRKTK